jgi:SPP1 gp7 family putative phage head morphogenesis protein
VIHVYNVRPRKPGLKNPLKADPTRTTLIRRQFQIEIRRRVNLLKKDVWDFVVVKDALGLKDRFPSGPGTGGRLGALFGNEIALAGNQTGLLTILAAPQPREFEFRTDAGKLKGFRDWLQEQIKLRVLSPSKDGEPGKPWTSKFIESAYKRGMVNAFRSSKKEQAIADQGFVDKSQDAFLKSAFGQPETTAKIELLATRAFEELKGVSEVMATQMNRALATGMVDGSGARDIARNMVDTVDNLTEKRALLIARTEVIHAHAEGQLDSFEELGVEELGVESEWSTAGDERVCPLCEEMEGKLFSIEEAHGMIPLHPNCVLGDQLVEFTNGLAVSRANYTGRIVRIQTAQGRYLSVTENHILATNRGWVKAKELRKLDNLICTKGFDFNPSQAPNNDQTKPCISEVFRFLAEMFPENLRTISRPRSEYFHGDGSLMKEQIDIVFSDSKLWDSSDSSFLQKAKQFSFMGGNIEFGKAQPLSSFGSFAQGLHRHFSSPYSIMGSREITCVFCGRSFAHHKPVSLGLSSDRNSGIPKPDINTSSATIENLGDFIDTRSFPVKFDHVLDIQFLEPGLSESGKGSAFVFDVWSHSLAYSLNGLLSSNCRCTWIPHIPEHLLANPDATMGRR